MTFDKAPCCGVGKPSKQRQKIDAYKDYKYRY